VRRNGFPKSQRLCSTKLIDELFAGGNSHSLTVYPLKLVYTILPSPFTLHPSPKSVPSPKNQVLISVSKRHFKHAVDRNRVKRQVREAYRLNQSLLAEAVPEGKLLLLAFVWMSDRLLPSDAVANRVKAALTRLSQRL
jgi:ribonuclease P protein component